VSQDYLGVARQYYRPTDRGFERELAVRLEAIRSRLRAGREEQHPSLPGSLPEGEGDKI
jgi:DNA-binding PadR family transcriptional regulator